MVKSYHEFYNKHLIIERILDMDPEINVKDMRGDTALIYALEFCESEKIINRILDKNPEINVRDNFGNTPLFCLLMYCDFEKIINRILDMNAEINVEDNLVQTPLMYALDGYNSDEIINRILNKLFNGLTLNQILDLVYSDEHKEYIKHYRNNKARIIQRNLENYFWRPKCKDLSNGLMVRRMIRELS